MIKAIIYCFLGFGICANVVMAQEDCSKNLKRAKKFYEEGNIEMVEGLLGSCIEEGFTKEEKVEAQKLLVLVSLFDDDTQMADEHMEEFLTLNPEYKIQEGKDQVEFIHLYNTFKTIPSISVGFTAGTNMTMINQYESYGVHAIGDETIKYSSSFGFQFGLKVNKQFTKNLTFELGVNYAQNDFTYQGTYYGGSVQDNAEEKQTWLRMPLVMSYSFLKGRFRPYLGGGASVGYLLKAQGEYSTVYTDLAERPLPSTSNEFVISHDQRTRLNAWYIGAVGFRYKIKHGLLSLDIAYQYNLLNQNVSDNRYTSSEVYFQTFHLNNDFYADHLNISFGYVYNFYNPKKKSHYRKKAKKEAKSE
ncbi:PorT family protein [Cyclobacteriaceae bacterium]|nr:PorT family protein [Cyclobacteriaceae bacterium]